MSSVVTVGLLALGLGGLSTIGGWTLLRRYGAAVNYGGIGRAYPLRHSVLAFLGCLLILAGVFGVLVAGMLLFL